MMEPLKFQLNMREGSLANYLSDALFTFISTFCHFEIRPSALRGGVGLGTATNFGTNICLSLSADEFLQVTPSGTAIERIPVDAQKLLRC